MAEQFLLKDVFNERNITELARSLEKVTHFDDSGFIAACLDGFASLSFSERNLHIAHCLGKYLPDSYPEAVNALLRALGGELDVDDLEGMEGFIIMPQCAFTALYGLDHFEESMKAQYELTKRFSAEFSIRYFILKYPLRTMLVLKKWAGDDNCHVRRLASEGCRPRLPMSIRLPLFIKDPAPCLEILELLKFDPVLYVRRSVANNLNDIAKDHPQLVTQLLTRWKSEGVDEWLIRHALRTLFKQGNTAALSLFGYDPQAKISSRLTLHTLEVLFGEQLQFCLTVDSAEEQALMIDYRIYFVKANGSLKAKVFKLRKLKLSGELTINKSHAIKPISTRKYYPGEHWLEILINGQPHDKVKFNLRMT